VGINFGQIPEVTNACKEAQTTTESCIDFVRISYGGFINKGIMKVVKALSPKSRRRLLLLLYYSQA